MEIHEIDPLPITQCLRYVPVDKIKLLVFGARAVFRDSDGRVRPQTCSVQERRNTACGNLEPIGTQTGSDFFICERRPLNRWHEIRCSRRGQHAIQGGDDVGVFLQKRLPPTACQPQPSRCWQRFSGNNGSHPAFCFKLLTTALPPRVHVLIASPLVLVNHMLYIGHLHHWRR